MKLKKFFFLGIFLACLLVFSACNVKQTSNNSKSEGDGQNLNKVIGIIGAMQEEINILKNNMNISKTTKISGMEFYEGTLHNKNIVLVQSGIGKVNAAMCAQTLSTVFKVSHIVNSGVAGALKSDLNQGDIVLSTDAVQHDFYGLNDEPGTISNMNIKFLKADNNLLEIAKQAGKSIGTLNVVEGRVASGDQFVGNEKEKTRISNLFNPYAVEMEGASIAQVAYLNNIPFLIIRSISDKADGGAELSFNEFLDVAAKNASSLLMKLIELV